MARADVEVIAQAGAIESRLQAIAAALNAEHEACAERMRATLVHAVRAGGLLKEAKGMLSHGQWLPWLALNFNGSERTVRNYMRVAAAFPSLMKSASDADLSYGEALRLLAGPREDGDGPHMEVHYSSETPEWYTPPEIIARVVRVLGAIDLDPCSNSLATPNVPAARHFTLVNDGLSELWAGRVYLNPPYGTEIGRWVAKLAEEHALGNVPAAVALVPARTDTAWFQQFRDAAVCFVRGRLRFSGSENSAPFPSAVVYLGADRLAFRTAFRDLGDVWVRWGDAA